MRVLYRVGAGIALYLCASHINDRILFAPFSERSTYGGTHAMAAAVGEENIGRQTRDLEEDLPSFILFLKDKYVKTWLKRWKDTSDPLFHPSSPLQS